MDLDAHINVIAGWLDVVHVESAQARVDEAVANFCSKQSGSVPVAATTDRELARACLHEAAHAVSGHTVGGLIVGCVRVRGGSGGCEYRGEDDSVTTVFALAEVDLAGIVAEFCAGRVDETRQFHLAHSPDVLQASVRLAQLRAVGWELTARTVVTMSACLVRTRWPEILRVAVALKALGELSAAEVAAMCERPQ